MSCGGEQVWKLMKSQRFTDRSRSENSACACVCVRVCVLPAELCCFFDPRAMFLAIALERTANYTCFMSAISHFHYMLAKTCYRSPVISTPDVGKHFYFFFLTGNLSPIIWSQLWPFVCRADIKTTPGQPRIELEPLLFLVKKKKKPLKPSQSYLPIQRLYLLRAQVVVWHNIWQWHSQATTTGEGRGDPPAAHYSRLFLSPVLPSVCETSRSAFCELTFSLCLLPCYAHSPTPTLVFSSLSYNCLFSKTNPTA